MNLYLAIDIGGTNTKFALMDKSGSVVEKYRIPTKSNSFEALVRDIKNSLGDYLKHIKGIGIGAPDVTANKLEIKGANNLFFTNANVVDVFTRQFGIPVALENDANIAAIGEKELGVAKEFSTFVVLTLGTGIGSGVFINDSLYQGGLGIGCELGHMLYKPQGRKCGCGLKGHVETYLSCPGICLTHKELHNESIRFSEFVAKVEKGDKIALETLDEVSEQFGEFLASIDTIFSPEAIILAGGGSVLGNPLLTRIHKSFDNFRYDNFRGHVKILLSNFTPEYGAIMGAFILAKTIK